MSFFTSQLAHVSGGRKPGPLGCIHHAGMVVLLAVGLTLVGCASQTPEEKIEATRGEFRAALNGFLIRQEPVEVAEAVVEGAVPVAESATGVDADLEVQDLAPVEVTQTALLDILISSDSYEKLPGLTLDVSLVGDGGAGAEKQRWLVWVDTSNLGKGLSTQITHQIEDVSYEDGDGFYAEIRNPIPESERGDYREFGSSL